MRRLLNLLLSTLLHGLAHLPFWALYALSDVLFAICYHLVRYRRKVVMKNLRESFPELSAKELRAISRRFYRNFCDYMVETIKVLHISDDEMRRRMEFVNADIIDPILSEGQSIAAYFSHCFNWEWAPSVTLWIKHKSADDPSRQPSDPVADIAQVYRPLKDQWFDSLMLKLRSRFHSTSIAKQHTLRHLLQARRDGLPSIVGFMADQKPSHGDPAYITMFLNHPTAMITGTEALARRLGMAAIYWDIEKPSRGHYRITCRLISRDLNSLPPMGATAEYARLLEATIRRDPAIWLWTHKRWKIPVEIKSDECSVKSEEIGRCFAD